MPHITCTLDPISFRDVHDLGHRPSIHEGAGEDQLTVYFENKQNRDAYLATPLEQPCGDIGIDRSNTTEEWIDNG